ncbi:hypothetical protein HMPREF9538_00949 [Klebsiella sp. MS 92-3]|nr:hypothetical protein HMPREF9538_00949 [Klebsiella sp. MS 92-3]
MQAAAWAIIPLHKIIQAASGRQERLSFATHVSSVPEEQAQPGQRRLEG